MGYLNLAAKRPAWQDISARFSDPRDCLVSFLALEAAEILAGAKPANLISIANRERSCGRNLYLLWKQWGQSVIEESGLECYELADRGESLLLLIYHPSSLAELLRRPNVTAILRRAGYPVPAAPEKLLRVLAARFTVESFPHEIGVFLGYPLKDVLGFLGWARIPFTCQGPWRIYGAAAESLRLAELHRECRCRMAGMLSAGGSPVESFRIGRDGRRLPNCSQKTC
ncbi:MAG TPA: DUF3793 family protein [Dongiaceae bacterium]|nr:DUF3793 family protein [Dongiaceae bacterium]